MNFPNFCVPPVRLVYQALPDYHTCLLLLPITLCSAEPNNHCFKLSPVIFQSTRYEYFYILHNAGPDKAIYKLWAKVLEKAPLLNCMFCPLASTVAVRRKFANPISWHIFPKKFISASNIFL